ncbi:MAG: SAM-dependent methyltransferase [Pseudonocardiaceae bacterium]
MADEQPDYPRAALASKINADVPHSARIWNYWMGGKDNYEVDRTAGDAGVGVYPDIVTMAKQSRQFLIRAVRYLASEAGIRQFLDIGTGLPTMQNTHEVAQHFAPESRIVYVDNDPLVLAHARALLVNTTPEGVTTYMDADFHDPDLIIADARNVLNFTQPIGVMFMGVLGHVAEFDDVRSIVARVMDAVPAGSYLAMYDGTDTNKAYVELCENYTATGGVPYIPRSIDQIAQCFEGLEMVDPGLVSITQWRPDTTEVGKDEPMDAAFGAVARKSATMI